MRFPTSSSPVESNTTILRASWPRSTTTLLHLLRSWSNNSSLLRYSTVMIGREIHPSTTLRWRDHSRFVSRKKLNCPYTCFSGAGMLKFTGDSTVVDGSVVVEYGEVVTVCIAVRAWIFSVGSVDDGGIKATGWIFHLNDGGEWKRGISVEIEIQHCEVWVCYDSVMKIWREKYI